MHVTFAKRLRRRKGRYDDANRGEHGTIGSDRNGGGMALNTAIRHLQRGDFEKAHAIVQNDNTEMGCWAHGIVHMLEGDLGNARYWYRRAGRPFPRERHASAEIDALVTALRQQQPAVKTLKQAGG